MESFARASLSVLTFTSNFHFYAESGYFAPTAAESPLLHTWSLAVEEQFYLLFPLSLLLVKRASRATQMTLVGLVCVSSLFLAEWLTGVDREASFFILPTRAWELGAGALLAYLPAAKRGSIIATAIGLLLVVGSFLVANEGSHLPGTRLVPTIVGTALVVHFARGRAASLLSSRLLVAVGLASWALLLASRSKRG